MIDTTLVNTVYNLRVKSDYQSLFFYKTLKFNNMEWKIQNKVYNLPFTTKKEVLDFVNSDIKVCPYCGKVDCSLEHINNCDYIQALEYDLKLEYFWK